MRTRKGLSICTILAMLICMLPLMQTSAMAMSFPDLLIFDISEGGVIIGPGTTGLKVTYENGTVKDNIPATSEITIVGTASQFLVRVEGGVTAKVRLSDVKINLSNLGVCAFEIKDSSTVTLELDGNNELNSGYDRAGLSVSDGSTIEIMDTDQNGSLLAKGGYHAAGIGGSRNHNILTNLNCGRILIRGGNITATGGQFAAGIGGGNWGNATYIEISGGTVVASTTASSNDFSNTNAAGIGGGTRGDAGHIVIKGDAHVTASGVMESAGIGGGGGGGGQTSGSGGIIEISGNAIVIAKSTDYGVGIGSGSIIPGSSGQPGIIGNGPNLIISGNANVTVEGGLQSSGAIGSGINVITGNKGSGGTLTMTGGTLNIVGNPGNVVPPALAITTASLPGVTAGQTYSQQLTFSGGMGAKTFTLESGALPAGLTLSSTGLIAGTTAMAESKTFDIKVTDSVTSQTDTKTLTIVVSDQGAPPAQGGPAPILPAPQPMNFTVSGNGQVYTGQEAGLTFAIDAVHSSFQGISGLQKGTHYEDSSGSTIIKLLPSYLNTLSDGNYTLTAIFVNGTATLSFSVNRGMSANVVRADIYPNEWATPVPPYTPTPPQKIVEETIDEGTYEEPIPNTGYADNTRILVYCAIIAAGLLAGVGSFVARRKKTR